MSIIYVNAYKEESGTEHAAPVMIPFDTNAVVSGHKERKPGVGVLIKFISGSWVEQSAYSAGTVPATRTSNPADGTTAYLYILPEDYTALTFCCTSNGRLQGLASSSGSGPGYLGGGRFDYAAGTVIEAVPGGYVNYHVPFTALKHAAPIGVYISGNMVVDWGDGVLYTYPPNVIVIKAYADNAAATIIVYHDHSPESLTIGDDAGGFRGVMGTITGTLPNALKQFQVTNGLANLPALPITVKQISLANCGLNATKLNTLLDFLIANGLTNGYLLAFMSPRADGDLTKLHTLQARQWNIQAAGIYPNL